MEFDIEKALAQNVQKQVPRNPQDQVKQAWDSSKNELKNEYSPTEPEYWPSVIAKTKDRVGLNAETPGNTNPMQKQSPMASPVFEEIERAKDDGAEDKDPQYQGYTKIENAQALCKKLKDKDADRNDIIFSLMNRMNLNIDQAIAIVDDKNIEDVFKADYNPTSAFAPLGAPQQGDDVSTPTDVEDKSKSKKKVKK